MDWQLGRHMSEVVIVRGEGWACADVGGGEEHIAHRAEEEGGPPRGDMALRSGLETYGAVETCAVDMQNS